MFQVDVFLEGRKEERFLKDTDPRGELSFVGESSIVQMEVLLAENKFEDGFVNGKIFYLYFYFFLCIL